MTIDAEDRRTRARTERPGRRRDARAGSEIEDLGGGGAVAADGADDVRDGQQVKRAVKQRECRPFTGGGEGRSGSKFLTALYICGRQCPERARDFGHPEVGKMTRFERRQPSGKAVVLR